MTGNIIILNGTSSSGKTSTLEALQESLAEPYLNMGIDKFIWMLPERYLERPLWDDVLGLASSGGQMGHQLARAMHHAIAAAAGQGMNVIADHVLVEAAWAQECAQLFADLPAWLVGIRCPLDVLEERERARRNRTLGQARAQFDVVHAHSLYDVEVDTSVYSAADCARQIIEHVQTQPPTALRRMRLRG